MKEVLQRSKRARNILQTIKRRKANWIGHILLRNCLLQHVIEGKIEGTERRGRKHKQQLDDFKEARGYCKVKEEALDRTVWGTGFGRGFFFFICLEFVTIRASPIGIPRDIYRG